jgi:bromodomain-containing protein 8
VPSTPVESLVKKLTAERVIELKKAIHEEQQMYAKLKDEVQFLQSSSMDEEARIREMWNQIEQENIQKECEKVRHDQWLKEREEKKREHERQWRGPYKANIRPQKSLEEIEPDTTTSTTQQQAGTSPLLTSLLKSPSQAPTVQQSTVSSSSSNSARVAPTITNLLTGSSSSSSLPSMASNSPLITQTSSAPNILINASSSSNMVVPNVINSASVSSVVSVHAHSAPTLIDLLDKKSSLTGIVSSTSSSSEKQQLLMSISVPESSGGGGCGKEGDMVKDEEAELLADFNEIIDCDKFDMDEDLEDLNSIIMNPEILDDKISDGEPIKDADDSSQATSTDDYDKLKIKQLVETIQVLAETEVQASSSTTAIVNPEEMQEKVAPLPVEESEIMQIPSETENSEPASVEMIEAPVESNDSTQLQTKNDSPTPDNNKIVMISDESSNTNDNDKKEEAMSDKVDTNDGDESQSAKSDDIKDPSGEDSNKEPQAFQGIPIAESDENSVGSEKGPKEPTNLFPLDDSDDAIFEDAREHHSGSDKLQESDSVAKEQSPEKSLSEAPETKTPKPIIVTESEEASRSAIDSDDEVMEVKVSRSTSRKKAGDSLKADTPSSSTRSRDHSENDDKSDSTPRTRSRHSSTAVSESKATQIFPKEQDHNMWKARWEDCAKELQKLKDYSQIVDNKVVQDDFYKKICLHPMNMKIIGKNIESHTSTLKGDIERDFVIMCTNIMMSSSKGPKFDEMVHQFMREGREVINSHMRVDDAYKSYRKQIKKQVL